MRYLRTSRARAALVTARTEMLSDEEAVQEGERAMREELLLQGIDPRLLADLGARVLAAVGRGALPVELASGQILAAQLAVPLGDAGYEYAEASALAEAPVAAEEATELCFLMLVGDKPGVVSEVVEAIREHRIDMTRFVAEPRCHELCLIIAKVRVDCTLRFGSLLHSIRYRTQPLLLESACRRSWAPRPPGALPFPRPGRRWGRGSARRPPGWTPSWCSSGRRRRCSSRCPTRGRPAARRQAAARRPARREGAAPGRAE
ncbi:unnamed protein product, partial [Prorocentrum cordatum]